MSMIAWKHSRKESCNEEQYIQATFQALAAHIGILRAALATIESRSPFANFADPPPRLTSRPGSLGGWLMENGGLVVSAYVGDLPAVRHMLASGIDVNKESSRFGSALNAAAYAGQTACVELLLDAGANATFSTSAAGLPIEVAAAQGHVETVRLLVDRGVGLGFSLPDALESGHEDVADLLLTLDQVDVNAGRSVGTPPLLLAMEAGCYRVAEKLARRPDLHPNRVGRKGRSALHKAAEADQLDLAKALLERPDTDVNLADERSLTALHISCRKGHHRITHALMMQSRVDANLVTGIGNTALTEAILCKNRHCATILLLRPDTDVTLSARPFRVPIVSAAYLEDLDTVRLLLLLPRLREAPNFLTMMSDALVFAAHKDNRSIVNEIIRAAPAAISTPTSLGYYPLNFLVSGNSLRGVSLLMSMCDVDINCFCMRLTPLMEAIINGHHDIITLLLSRPDIDVNLASSQGTALTWAVNLPTDYDYQLAELLLGRPEIDPNLGALGQRRWIPWLYREPILPSSGLEVLDEDELPWYTMKIEWRYLTVGPPPLALAAEDGSSDMADLLLRHRDIDPNRADSLGRTPLWYAVHSPSGTCDTVAVLLGHAATNPNLADCFGWTPLLLAVGMDKPDMVETLMDDLRTDPAVASNDGCTPWKLATRMERPDLVALLERDFDTVQDERSLSIE